MAADKCKLVQQHLTGSNAVHLLQHSVDVWIFHSKRCKFIYNLLKIGMIGAPSTFAASYDCSCFMQRQFPDVFRLRRV